MKLRHLHFILVGISLTLSSGCLHFEQVIEIRENNKGVFQYNISMPIDIYQSMKDTESIAPHTIFQFFDPKHGNSYFADEPGLSIDRYRVYERKDRIYVKIKGLISNLKKTLDSKKLGDFSLIKHSEDDTYLLRLSLEPHSDFFKKDTDPEKMEKMRNLLKGTTLSLTLKVPNKIVDSSARIESKKSVKWIFDISKNDDFLKNRPDIFVSFK